jgi:hypothetical protein
LVVRKVELIDFGLYSVKVTNIAGHVSAEAHLKVIERQLPPVFVRKLDHQDIYEDDDALFECIVNGKPLPEITWYHKGKELIPSDKIKTHQTCHNEELKMSVTMVQVALHDSGDLKAVAKNPAGIATASAVLTVNMRTIKPIIVKRPLDQEITEEEGCIFEAEVIGKPDPVVQWLKGDLKIAAGDRYSVEQTGQTYVLKLPKSRPEDSGLYKIRAINMAGEATSTFRLTVNEPEPSAYFMRLIEDQLVTEGMPATFVCEVFPPS